MEKLYDIWFVPTEKGKKEFGWIEEKTLLRPLPKEDASHECYLMGLDDPATDKREYGRYEIREANRQ